MEDSTGDKAYASTARCGPMGFDTEILIIEKWTKGAAAGVDATSFGPIAAISTPYEANYYYNPSQGDATGLTVKLYAATTGYPLNTLVTWNDNSGDDGTEFVIEAVATANGANALKVSTTGILFTGALLKASGTASTAAGGD